MANGRAVVIAAYAHALKDGGVTDRAAAFESSLLLGAVVTAAGAYHHTLAEGDRLLTEGYYPAAVPMSASEVDELRAIWRFSARYVHLLSSPDQVLVTADGIELVDENARPVPTSDQPATGSVWVRAVDLPGRGTVLHLIDFREQRDDRWTTPSRTARVSQGMRIRWAGASPLLAASPWSAGSDLRRVPAGGDGGWQLPEFRRWLMVVRCAEVEAACQAPRSSREFVSGTAVVAPVGRPG
jgi:hypothetical protein